MSSSDTVGRLIRLVVPKPPLREIHRHADLAAEEGEVAATHGRFWEVHDTLFENQQRSEIVLLPSIRSDRPRPGQQFLTCDDLSWTCPKVCEKISTTVSEEG